eukprot:UC4_evm1s518
MVLRLFLTLSLPLNVGSSVPVTSPKILAMHPHDPNSFTEGLFYETTRHTLIES